MVLRSDLLPFEMKWSCMLQKRCASLRMSVTWETLVAFFRTSVLGTVALVVDSLREDE